MTTRRVRKATPDDCAALERIQGASPSAAQWPVAEYLAYSCAVVESDKTMGDSDEARAGLDEAPVAGFIVWRQAGPGENEILNLAVDPGLRRKGMGRQLLKFALDSDYSGIWFLEVRESNQAAISFYESYGFQIKGHRKLYYRDPVEAGIVMSFDSCYRHVAI